VSCAFLALILVSSFFVGCFGDDEDEVYSGPINLTVGVAETSGMIEIIKGQNNQTISENYVTFDFDFSQVTSEGSNIAAVYLIADDGSDKKEQDPNENAVISHEYTSHGIFDVTLGASDENDNSHEIKMKLRVDYLVWYNESATAVPDEIWIDTTPGSNTSVGPSRIHVVSIVENPEAFLGIGGGGASVTFRMNDETGTEVSSHTENIADGDSYEWETEWPNPNPGAWEVEFEVEGDNVNSNTVVMIHYPEEESEPVELESSMEESESEE